MARTKKIVCIRSEELYGNLDLEFIEEIKGGIETLTEGKVIFLSPIEGTDQFAFEILSDEGLEKLRDAGFYIDDHDSWKPIALYLADCHAATAGHECSLKSTPKGHRDRYKGICQTAIDMIKGTTNKRVLSTKESVLDRLQAGIETE